MFGEDGAKFGPALPQITTGMLEGVLAQVAAIPIAEHIGKKHFAISLEGSNSKASASGY